MSGWGRHYWGTTTHKAWQAWVTVRFCAALIWRSVVHDLSKYRADEARYFAKTITRLRGSTYGSKYYKKLLAELGPGLGEHYYRNRHHPECHVEGVAGMNLLDLVEMFTDWYAATKRHKDGDIVKSVAGNRERFEIGNDLCNVLLLEAHRMKPTEKEKSA